MAAYRLYYNSVFYVGRHNLKQDKHGFVSVPQIPQVIPCLIVGFFSPVSEDILSIPEVYFIASSLAEVVCKRRNKNILCGKRIAVGKFRAEKIIQNRAGKLKALVDYLKRMHAETAFKVTVKTR